MALLNDQERRQVLAFVRRVLAGQIEGSAMPEIPPIPQLDLRGSCFVTLFENGSVRGCIGGIEAVEPLGKSLIRHAVNAGFGDPMFPPLAGAELEEVSIEVSLVTAVRKIASPEEFLPERDGIILLLRERRGIFLPLVAQERQWSREETLDALAAKIGAEPGAWKARDAELSIFTLEHFGEPRREAAEI